MSQVEMSAPISVIDGTGRFGNYGWARSPLYSYDSSLQWSRSRRIIASDRYIVISPTHLVSMEILDTGALGIVGISVVSLLDNKRSSHSYTTPYPLGRFGLPDSSEDGGVRVVTRRFGMVEFVPMSGGVRILKIDIPRFGRRRSLRGALVLTPPPDGESLVTHTPMALDEKAFMLSRRSPWYIAEGVMQHGKNELVFSQGNSWGVFDWNRGCRSKLDVHYWATACGMAEDQQAALSIGYGLGDSSLGTENAFFLDGRIHKLDQVTFHISPTNWLEPWRFTSNDNRLEMNFIPSQERTERHRMFFHTLNRRQVFGAFSGTVVLDDGAEFAFTDLTGFAERRKMQF